MVETTGVPDLIAQGLQSTQARGKLVCIGVPPLDFSFGVNMVEHINVSYRDRDFRQLFVLANGSVVRPLDRRVYRRRLCSQTGLQCSQFRLDFRSGD